MSKEKKNMVPMLRFPEFKNNQKWEERTLEQVSPSIFDGTHQTPKYIQQGIPFFSVENIISGNKNKFISREDYLAATSKNKPEKGDILITRIGNIGYSKVVDWSYEFSIYVTLAVVKKSELYIPHYLHSFFQSDYYQREIKSKSLLNAVPCKINMDELRKTKILIPPDKEQKEQQKIASCLSSLDNLITAHTQKLDALKAHKKGLMQQLFPAEGERVPKFRFEEFKDSGEWEENVLCGKDIAFFVNEKMELDELELISYVSTENLLSDYGGKTTSLKLPSSGSATRFKIKDILLSNIRPYLKKVWFATSDGGASNDVIVIRANLKLEASFLSLLLINDNFINFVMKGAEGVKMPRGDKDLIKLYRIAFPNKEEQKKIASCISSLDDLITQQAEKIEQLKNHKKGLMQGLFPVLKENN